MVDFLGVWVGGGGIECDDVVIFVVEVCFFDVSDDVGCDFLFVVVVGVFFFL